MVSDLLPCPFCGGEATIEREGETYWCIHCDTCDIIVEPFVAESHARQAWNTRQPAAAVVWQQEGNLSTYYDDAGGVWFGIGDMNEDDVADSLLAIYQDMRGQRLRITVERIG